MGKRVNEEIGQHTGPAIPAWARHTGFASTVLLFALRSFLSVPGQPVFAQDSTRIGIHQLQHHQYERVQPVEQSVQVTPGMEMLLRDHLWELEGKDVGLVVNQTAVGSEGVHLVDRLLEHDIHVAAIFAPEHGYRGEAAAGQQIENGVDPVSGARVYSLYGAARKPTDQMMQGLDVLLYDIQDVGVRFYTYISTLGYAMQAAARNGVAFWVLDRPDPITGARVNGPVLKKKYRSFVGLYPIPVRYGMTPGELARMIVGEDWLDFPRNFQPRVIQMKNWQRELWQDQTDLPWVAPSPNMPDLATAAVYPGMCFVEGTNISEGRGTAHPFLWIGAPWIDGKRLSQTMNRLQLPGVVFVPITFRPEDIPGKAVNPKYEGKACQGVRLEVTDRSIFRAIPTGVSLLASVRAAYPDSFRWRESAIDRLYGSDKLRMAIDHSRSPEKIISGWQHDLKKFRTRRQKYLLY